MCGRRPTFTGFATPGLVAAEVQRDQQRDQSTVQYYTGLLLHAAGCAGCALGPCRRMQSFLVHQRDCALSSVDAPLPASPAAGGGSGHGGTHCIRACCVPFCNDFKARMRTSTGFGSGLDVRRRAKANALAVGERPDGDDDRAEVAEAGSSGLAQEKGSAESAASKSTAPLAAVQALSSSHGFDNALKGRLLALAPKIAEHVAATLASSS